MGPARLIETFDPECDDRAGDEERMEFVGGIVEFQDRIVAEPEPHEMISLPHERNAQKVAEHRNHLIQTAGADADEVHLDHRHMSILFRRPPALTPPVRSRTPRAANKSFHFSELSAIVVARAKSDFWREPPFSPGARNGENRRNETAAKPLRTHGCKKSSISLPNDFNALRPRSRKRSFRSAKDPLRFGSF